MKRYGRKGRKEMKSEEIIRRGKERQTSIARN